MTFPDFGKPADIEPQCNITHGNLISYMPLLFVSGEPRRLESMSVSELECFIPYMIRCANPQKREQWWPPDVRYRTPFAKPDDCEDNWLEKMRTIVQACYKYHDAQFFLFLSRYLAAHIPTVLRFIHCNDQTSMIVDKHNGKLIVTVRTESIFYDAAPERRPKERIRIPCVVQNIKLITRCKQLLVEVPAADTYVCERCFQEYDCQKTFVTHHKDCNEMPEICGLPQVETLDSQPRSNNCQKIAKKFMQNMEYHRLAIHNKCVESKCNEKRSGNSAIAGTGTETETDSDYGATNDNDNDNDNDDGNGIASYRSRGNKRLVRVLNWELETTDVPDNECSEDTT